METYRQPQPSSVPEPLHALRESSQVEPDQPLLDQSCLARAAATPFVDHPLANISDGTIPSSSVPSHPWPLSPPVHVVRAVEGR